MKKIYLFVLASVMMLFSACHDKIWDAIDDLDARVAKLEELCKEMNTNISSLQAIVSVIQENDYITGILPIEKGGEVIGYTIMFGKHDPITIYNGEDGKDGTNSSTGQGGYTPILGVAKDADGVYYWTLNGEWLLDAEGNKIRVTGENGKDGADGKDGQDGKPGENGENGEDGQPGKDGKDGITPKLKIENGYWYVSYDNEVTWIELGKAVGEDGKNGQDGKPGADGQPGKDGVDGDSMFLNVTYDENNVYFTLTNGTILVVPRGNIGESGEVNLSNVINFRDLAVKSALLKLGVDTTGDGEISYGEAAAYTGIIEIINNQQIHSFKEFKYFCNINAFIFEGCTNLFEISIPENLKSVEENAFYNCSSLTFIILPSNITSLGNKAFYGCSSLTSMNIPNTVTTLGENLFYACSSLSFVNIPNNITNISKGMFYGCSSLKSIDIPNNIITIGEDAFNGCTSLSIINMPNSVVKIGTHAFSGCKTFVYPEKLSFTYPTYFYTPSSLTSVYWNTINYSSLDNGLSGTSWRKGVIFATAGENNNYSIEKVIIGDNVQHIPDYLCYGIKNLTEFTIPNSVTSIGYNPFFDCSNLKYIYCKATTPPTSSNGGLYFPSSVVAIYVPATSLGDYLISWSNYADKIVGYDF